MRTARADFHRKGSRCRGGGDWHCHRKRLSDGRQGNQESGLPSGILGNYRGHGCGFRENYVPGAAVRGQEECTYVAGY